MPQQAHPPHDTTSGWRDIKQRAPQAGSSPTHANTGRPNKTIPAANTPEETRQNQRAARPQKTTTKNKFPKY
ncbi:MAG: hypothetical protein QW261_07190 [Candidatus Jordarchaeaceae archaeon]